MSGSAFAIPDKVRRTARLRGAEGDAWLAGLPKLIADIERAWNISIGRTYPNGTEAYVAEAVMADGTQAAIKIAIAGLDPTRRELSTLLAANGRGYVRVLRQDADRGIMLLERLGLQLHQLGLPLDAQIEIICATLKDAWMPMPSGLTLMSGAEKAASLAALVEKAWAELGKPCSERAVDKALAFARLRRDAFDPRDAVFAHGDAHCWNTLMVPGEGPRRFKLVDPDGLFVERAYDLCISLREWSAELLAGDPLELGRRRCHLIARLSGISPEPIWQWGFIERVANGLLLKQAGLDEVAGEFFAVADAWAQGDL